MKSLRVHTVSRRKFLIGASAAATLQQAPLWAQAVDAANVVKAPSGTVRGKVVEGVRAFRGIPFAEPPVGPLRFRPPVKAKPWTGERDATQFSAIAMQAGSPNAPHSEDCLYLNVYTPLARPAAPMPVLVWIHGGGFTAASARGDAAPFAREGIVTVMVPYRLGVFGFLDVSPMLGASYAGSANNGVRDVLASLEWVRDNIAAFGGDPARVTIGGESAGGKMVDILLGTPAAKPLFAQAICESGGADRVWPSAALAQQVSAAYGEVWKRTSGKSPAEIAAASGDGLIAAQAEYIKDCPFRGPLKPEVDGTLLPEMPITAIASGSARGKRLLIGTNREESAGMIGIHPAEVKSNQLGNLPPAKFADVLTRYKAVYPDMPDEHRRIQALTAEEYWMPSMRAADAMVKGGGTAFVYLFELSLATGKHAGYAQHGAELNEVFEKSRAEPSEAALARSMHPAWVAFLRGQVPTAPGLPAWPAYKRDTRPTMIFNTESRIETKPQEAELRLWDGLL